MTTLVALAIVWRFLHFASLIILLGAALFRLQVIGTLPRMANSPVRSRPIGEETVTAFDRWLWALFIVTATIALVSGLGWLVAVTQDMTGNLADALGIAVLADVLTGTEFGEVWAGRLAILSVLVALIIVAGLRGRIARPSIAILGAIALASLSAVGHAVSGTGVARNIHQAVDAVHLFVAAIWLGGLTALLRLLTLPGQDAIALTRGSLPRFSWVALVAAGLVVATGIGDAAFLVAGPAALIGTGYGRLLLAKIVIVSGMIALGTLNRFALLPTLGGPEEGRGLLALRQSIAAELGLGLAAIAIVAVLGMITPGR